MSCMWCVAGVQSAPGVWLHGRGEGPHCRVTHGGCEDGHLGPPGNLTGTQIHTGPKLSPVLFFLRCDFNKPSLCTANVCSVLY